MGTALIYLLVVVLVAAAFFGIAALVFGRGEELPPLPPDATPTRLPSRAIGAQHVRALRFPLALRGYRMAEVDWVIDRLAGELDRAEAERDELQARIAELEATRQPELEATRQPELEAARRPELEATRQPELEATRQPGPEARRGTEAGDVPAREDGGSARIAE